MVSPFWASGRGYLSNFAIAVYRECFYGEPFLGVLTGVTSQIPQDLFTESTFMVSSFWASSAEIPLEVLIERSII